MVINHLNIHIQITFINMYQFKINLNNNKTLTLIIGTIITITIIPTMLNNIISNNNSIINNSFNNSNNNKLNSKEYYKILQLQNKLKQLNNSKPLPMLHIVKINNLLVNQKHNKRRVNELVKKKQALLHHPAKWRSNRNNKNKLVLQIYQTLLALLIPQILQVPLILQILLVLLILLTLLAPSVHLAKILLIPGVL